MGLRIATYAEHCTQAGQVAGYEGVYFLADQEPPYAWESDDYEIWADDSSDHLLDRARRLLAIRGAPHAHVRRSARAVIALLE